MADDDKGTGDPTPVEPSAKPEPTTIESSGSEPSKLDEPSTPAAARPRSATGMHSEWTVSDRRGPMEQAPDPDVERFVPAHELDAEGDIDHSAGPTADRDEAADHAAIAPPPTGETLGAPADPEPAARRRSFIPFAAGIVGAVVGAGSAWLVYSQAPGNADELQKIASLAARVDALEKRPAATPGPDLSKLQGDVNDLRGKVAALDKVPAPTAPSRSGAPAGQPSGSSDGALAAKVAALGAAVEALQAKGGASAQGDEAKAAGVQSGLAEARKQAAAAQSAADGAKAGQKQLDDKLAALTTAVAGAQKQAQGTQADLDGVRKAQSALEGKLGSLALAVVADSLVQQIGAGQSYARQVDALAALGADPAKVAVLRENAAQGVPSAQTLAARWKPLVEPVIATGNKAPAGADLGQRLEHGLFGLVSVRRADGTVGDDLASRVNLIAAELAAADVPGAYKTWDALPPDAKARSADWGAQAKTSNAALAAARDLQRQAIDALGAKKS